MSLIVLSLCCFFFFFFFLSVTVKGFELPKALYKFPLLLLLLLLLTETEQIDVVCSFCTCHAALALSHDYVTHRYCKHRSTLGHVGLVVVGFAFLGRSPCVRVNLEVLDVVDQLTVFGQGGAPHGCRQGQEAEFLHELHDKRTNHFAGRGRGRGESVACWVIHGLC